MADNSPDDSGDTGSVLTVTPRDRDAMVRTIVGEAGNQSDLGQAAVAHTIMNRVIDGGYGDTPTAVVLAPGQFEPNANGLPAVPPSSPQYKAAANVVDGVLSGDIPDPTNGATHFLNPTVTAQRSGKIPTWAVGRGVQIGQHVFIGGRDDDDNDVAPPPPSQAPQAKVAGGAAFAGGVSYGSPTPAAPGGPASPASMSDGDLEALITGRPSAPAAAAPAMPGAAPQPTAANPAAMSDADLEKMIVGTPAAPAPGAPPAPQPALTPQQLASGRDPQTGEVVVGGKPFTSDAGHWNGAVNFANGALQGAATPIMAGVQALKEKLANNSPLSLGNLYDQARSAYQGGRADYAAQNPLNAPATEIAGSLATALPAMALGGAAAGSAGNMLLNGARATPALSGVVPFLEGGGNLLTGTAGTGTSALRTINGAKASPTVQNLLLRGASLGTSGAIQGATGAAISSGLSDQPIVNQLTQGAAIGGAAGVGIPALFGAGRTVTNKLLGGSSVSPENALLAQTARDGYGVPIRGGQITESPGVRFMDSTLSRTPGMGYSGDQAAQNIAFNKAVANTIGEDASKITPAVMASAKTRIGAALDDAASKTTIRADNQFGDKLGGILRDAQSVLVPSEMTPLQKQVQNVADAFDQNHTLSGEGYQALTRKGAPLDRAMNSSDSNVRFYAGQIRDALDDVMERSASPDVLGQLQTARGQYKAMKTIEPLVEKSTTGDVSPAALMQAVRGSYNGMAYGGGGSLGDLARIGQQFLKEPPSSGTAERTGAKNLLTNLGAMGAAALGVDKVAPYAAATISPQAVPFTLGGMAGTYLAGRLGSSVLRSPAYANMLINGALGLSQQPGPVNKLIGDLGPKALPLTYNRLTQRP